MAELRAITSSNIACRMRGLIAAIRHGIGEPPAHTELPLGLAQEEEAGSDELLPPSKSDCELLAADGWQIEGKRRIVGHGGRGVALIREAPRVDSDCYVNLAHLHHSRQKIAHAWCMIRLGRVVARPRTEALACGSESR